MYTAVGLPIFYGLACYIWQKKETHLLHKPIETVTNETIREKLLNLHIQIIENFDNPSWTYLKVNLLTIHRINCSKRPERNCICQTFSTMEPTKLMGFSILETILEEQIKTIPKSKSIAFAELYISLYRRQNLFKASLIYQKLKNQRNNLQDSLSLMKIGQILEDRIKTFNVIKNDQFGKKSFEQKPINIKQLLDFEIEFFKIRENMVVVCLAKDALLNDLDTYGVNIIEKIDSHSALIYKKSMQIHGSFDYLIKLRPDSTALLVIYVIFNLHVLNIKAEAKRAALKIQSNREEVERNSRNRPSVSRSIKGLISINLCDASRGRIVLVDQYMLNMLGYRKDELIGKNLSEILPAHLASRHDQYLKAFGNTDHSQVVNHKRLRFFVNKDNFLVPVTLEVKFHFTLKTGIDVVGLVYEYMAMERYQIRSRLRYYLTYNQITGDIGYVCKNCSHYFGF